MASSKRVMIVDGDTSSTQYLKAMVIEREPQWEVLEVHSAEEAMCQSGVDAIALNQNLQGVEPLQFVQQLHDTYPGARLGLMAKKPQLDDLDIVGEDYHLAFIQKPLTEQKIMGFLYGE